jgi:hypothetical protein
MVDNRITHFNLGVPKPWKYPQKIPEHFLYWRIFLESEWRDQVVEAIMDVAAEVDHNKKLSDFRTGECCKLLLKRLLHRLFHLDRLWSFRGEIAVILKELWYRLTKK